MFAFRIIQELITNTIKHAEATQILLAIYPDGENIIIKYQDNGKGIQGKDIEELYSKNSLGYSNIFKRINLLKGEISFENSVKGLSILLSFKN